MDLNYLRRIIRLLERSGVSEIEIEEEGLRVRVAKPGHEIMPHIAAHAVPAVHPIAHPTAIPAAPAQSGAAAPGASPASPEAADVKYHEIKSPIVGTFYRASSPDAQPFVEIGQVVQPKSVLCIIEAMKLMNEIESDVSGKIIRIMVENGQPVEYDQTLFLIEPA